MKIVRDGALSINPTILKQKTYLNDAAYLKVGQNTYVDRIFANAVVVLLTDQMYSIN